MAFVLAALTIVAGHGKDYYLAPAFPPLFATGGIVIARLLRNAFLRIGYLTAAVTLALLLAPLALPILPPGVLVAYERTLHLSPPQQEKADAGDALPSMFADMLGWHDFVRTVGVAFDALPPGVRARTSILVDNYGEAAALDVYGGAYDLPPALSGHNQYFFWGQRGQHPANLLRIQFHPDRLKPYCAAVSIVTTTQSHYARSFENGKTVAFCRNLHPSLPALWPLLRSFV